MSDAEVSFAALHEAAQQRFAELWHGVGEGSKLLLVQRHVLAVLRMLSVDVDAMRSNEGLLRCLVIEDMSSNALTSLERADQLVIVCNPDVALVQRMTCQWLGYRQRYAGASCHMWLVPQTPLMVEHLVRHELAVSSEQLRLAAFDVDCVELEEGVLSMQQPGAFADLYAGGDLSVLSWVARALLKLQTSFVGVVPDVHSKGPRAAQVLRLVTSLQAELDADFLHALPSRAHHLLVLDRSVDMVTPLMTQLTYAGLLDELYGVECNTVRLPFSLGEGSAASAPQTVGLDAAKDKVYAELRDKNFANVGAALYQRSVEVKQQYERRKGVHELKELKAFMKSLPELQELHRFVGVHTTIATEVGRTTQDGQFRRRVQIEQFIVQQLNDREVLSHIEDLIDTQEPLPSVLRLLCLYSLVNGGLRTRDYDALREGMMLSYGIPLVMATFRTLEQCSLLVRRGEHRESAYAELRTRYRTWNDKLNEQKPDDIAFAYSGYASLLVRLVERFVQQPRAWREREEATSVAAGSTTPQAGKGVAVHSDPEPVRGPKTFIVCVLGGVTMAELSALRFVQDRLARTGDPHRLVVMTTHVCTGTQLMRSLLPTSA